MSLYKVFPKKKSNPTIRHTLTLTVTFSPAYIRCQATYRGSTSTVSSVTENQTYVYTYDTIGNEIVSDVTLSGVTRVISASATKTPASASGKAYGKMNANFSTNSSGFKYITASLVASGTAAAYEKSKSTSDYKYFYIYIDPDTCNLLGMSTSSYVSNPSSLSNTLGYGDISRNGSSADTGVCYDYQGYQSRGIITVGSVQNDSFSISIKHSAQEISS